MRLKNLLLNQDTLLTIAQWVTVSFLPSSTGKPVESSLSCLYQLSPSLSADLLVRCPPHGHRLRHHHGSLHQVLRRTHAFQVESASIVF